MGKVTKKDKKLEMRMGVLSNGHGQLRSKLTTFVSRTSKVRKKNMIFIVCVTTHHDLLERGCLRQN